MIHVIATIDLKPGTRQAFLNEFHRVMPAVRAEVGCLEYGPAVDIATSIAAQVPVRPDAVVIVEKWADLAALENHLKSPHMAEYRTRVKEMVVRAQLQILQPACSTMEPALPI